MKKIKFLLLGLILVCSLFTGCLGKSSISLTEEQEANIDIIVQHRNEWEETMEGISTLPVTRVHVSEADDGMTVLSVGYVKDTKDGWEVFAGVRGYAVEDNEFISIGSYHHENWIAGYDVDLENMSDKELREVLVQSYIDYLSK